MKLERMGKTLSAAHPALPKGSTKDHLGGLSGYNATGLRNTKAASKITKVSDQEGRR